MEIIMRPIYLEIEGLQSYKNLQKIDFEKLMEGGLFGIFGKTGSGKSTVLDAITLALYGKVSRASRGTQGIMNSESDRMRVLFKFSLMQGDERNVYLIERVFARKNGAAIEPKTARMFLCKPEGELPLAEKVKDIEQVVTELIGLEYEDFTRAVVLPQNKFHEFLTMEKSKKLSMLERLFNLSEYGEKLNEKVKVKSYETEKEFENIKGTLSAVGNSDDNALAAAKKKFEDLESKKTAELEGFKNAENDYVRVKDLYETSSRLTKLESDLEAALGEKDYYERLNVKLNLSKKAKEIEPLWEKHKELIKISDENARKSVALKETAAHTTELKDQTAARLAAAKQNSESTLPKLYDRKSKLEQGIDLQKKFDELKKSIEEKEAKSEELKDISLNVAEEKNKNRIRHAEIASIIGGYDAFFKENKPKLQLRTKLIEGQKLEHEAEAAKAEAENAKAVLERLNADKEKTEADIEAANKNIAELSEKYEKRKGSVESTINQYKSFKADYTEEKSKLEAEIENLLLNETAYTLAKNLSENEPCPVCGSIHHPTPAVLKEESAARIEECRAEIKHFEKEIEDADKIILGFTNGYGDDKKSDLLIEIDELSHSISALTARRDLGLERLETLKTQISDASLKAEGAIKIQFEKGNILSKFMAENGLGVIAEEMAKLDDIEKEITTTEAEIYNLRQENDALNEKHSAILEKQSQLETELAVTANAVNEQKQALHETSLKLAELVEEGTVYDAIAQVKAEIDAISAEQESAAARFDELTEALAKNAEETANLEKEIIKINADHAQINEKIAAILEGTDISSPEIILQAKLSDEMETNYNIEKSQYESGIEKMRTEIALSHEKLKGKTVSSAEYDKAKRRFEKASARRDEILSTLEVARNELEKLTESNRKWKIVNENHSRLMSELDALNAIKKLLAGNKFVEYVAEESLRYVLLEASEILASLTNGRYRIELGSEGEFVVKDYLSGGSYRTVGTLSGGETFLTSLSLAVALSKQIQLKGKSPLEFFFLDEGFGSLDTELLDTVISSLEKLSGSSRVIGVVSHLKQLQERIPRRLYVSRDEYNSSTISLETV